MHPAAQRASTSQPCSRRSGTLRPCLDASAMHASLPSTSRPCSLLPCSASALFAPTQPTATRTRVQVEKMSTGGAVHARAVQGRCVYPAVCSMKMCSPTTSPADTVKASQKATNERASGARDSIAPLYCHRWRVLTIGRLLLGGSWSTCSRQLCESSQDQQRRMMAATAFGGTDQLEA